MTSAAPPAHHPYVSADVASFLEREVGPCSVDRVPGRVERDVVRLVDAAGAVWFGKRLAGETEWSAELRAYREWVPAFQDQAPSLRAADEGLRVLVTGAVPGHSRRGWAPALHTRAGALLRRIHDSCPPRRRTTPVGHHLVEMFEARMRTAAQLFTRRELDFARGSTRALADLPAQALVPCHGDYRPHNWVVDERGTVRVLDFARSRWQVPAFDLTALYLTHWWGKPRLHDAFIDGYGRQLADHELEFMRLRAPSLAMTRIQIARRWGDVRAEARRRDRLTDLLSG